MAPAQGWHAQIGKCNMFLRLPWCPVSRGAARPAPHHSKNGKAREEREENKEREESRHNTMFDDSCSILPGFTQVAIPKPEISTGYLRFRRPIKDNRPPTRSTTKFWIIKYIFDHEKHHRIQHKRESKIILRPFRQNGGFFFSVQGVTIVIFFFGNAYFEK